MLSLTPTMKVSAPDFSRDLDLTGDELSALLALACEMKLDPRAYANSLAGKSIALLFEKPSLRTRITFELAIQQLGGFCVSSDGPIGAREPLKDIARNLERWVSGIVARTFLQSTIDELARWSGVPVINALSDLYHPCQALADFLTLQELFGRLRGLKLAFVGDGNNVAHSLMLTAARLGMDFAIATPQGYSPDAGIVTQAEGLAAVAGGSVIITHDAETAVASAHAIYTDVWASMGQETEAERRRDEFGVYRITPELFNGACDDAVFMHCLPAKRGEEVTDEVIESPYSVVFDQAENRLHVQKALLLMMLS